MVADWRRSEWVPLDTGGVLCCTVIYVGRHDNSHEVRGRGRMSHLHTSMRPRVVRRLGPLGTGGIRRMQNRFIAYRTSDSPDSHACANSFFKQSTQLLHKTRGDADNHDDDGGTNHRLVFDDGDGARYEP